MLKYTKCEEQSKYKQFLLKFEGYYGDMDYDYFNAFAVPETDHNKEIIEHVLDATKGRQINDEDLTEQVNLLLKQFEDCDDCWKTSIITDENDYYPTWELKVFYFDDKGVKFEVGLQ